MPRHDPELLAWVHATLLDSILIAYETFVGPLTAEEKSEYCAEASVMTTRLGVPAGRLPMTATALDAEMRAMYASGDLCIGPAARELSAALLAPPIGPASPVFGLVRVLTTGLLPPEIRQAYGFDWTSARDRQWRRLARVVRGLRECTALDLLRVAGRAVRGVTPVTEPGPSASFQEVSRSNSAGGTPANSRNSLMKCA